MNAYQIILRPWVTEKATSLIDKNQYVFEVAVESNKIEIRKAVEEIFGVQVKAVNTLNVKGKLKRRRTRQGITEGFTKTRKKAIVTLTADSKRIELFEGA
ncbi:MAG: LSU ribosomal protein L23p (L23Ae) [uncultured Chloroflexia bacterium]|uniref:Large ribosomal subunit protein uL23 n=1 Tax=uncultured Chloroflexia bacterium TaxID=1672391 RepID=A0A6J4I2N2_9CHLR|nr:MAG: LSU ribosomal protein L23p (L23Ae) [uncultured Chloroflexia bacterium]